MLGVKGAPNKDKLGPQEKRMFIFESFVNYLILVFKEGKWGSRGEDGEGGRRSEKEGEGRREEEGWMVVGGKGAPNKDNLGPQEKRMFIFESFVNYLILVFKEGREEREGKGGRRNGREGKGGKGAPNKDKLGP
jgi:hypothetical protein